MSDEQFQREKLYQVTMMIANNLRTQGIISDEEYGEIDTIFRQKYAASLTTLFTDLCLINYGDRGNM